MTVCLTMIVKNESAVIRRCLDSVRPFIDCWCIVDTGSADGTQDVIRQHMRDVPGELIERPWVDQQHNRNEAMELARPRADHLLLIDADEELRADPGFAMPALTHDCYDFTVSLEPWDCEFPRCIVVSTKYVWQWRGKRHPGLYGEGAQNPKLLPGITLVAHSDGASWADPAKYRQHVQDMRAQVEADPDNPRTHYYLAQSYRDAGMLEQALDTYMQCAEMGKWPERKWSALYEAAKLRERLGHPLREVVAGYLAAVQMREHRAEPLYHAARYLRQQGVPAAGLAFAREAAALPKPQSERMFLEPGIYRWRALDEWALCAYFAGEIADAQQALAKLREVAPQSESARIMRNAVAVGLAPCK